MTDLGALESLSGMVFAVSMTLAVEDRKKRLTMLLVLTVLTAFHAIAATFEEVHLCADGGSAWRDFPGWRCFSRRGRMRALNLIRSASRRC